MTDHDLHSRATACDESRRHHRRHSHSARPRRHRRGPPSRPRSANHSQTHASPEPRTGTRSSRCLRSNRPVWRGHSCPRNWHDTKSQFTARIDEVVVTYFAKPHSYTTDDIIEISAHGSPVVLRHIVELALARGARLAEPGEFTMRAFLNGRLDLTQAEAVRDLIDSQTLFQAKVAAQQLEGALSNRLKPIKQRVSRPDRPARSWHRLCRRRRLRRPRRHHPPSHRRSQDSARATGRHLHITAKSSTRD